MRREDGAWHGQDVRNNSAWNQRFFVLANTRDLASVELAQAEIEYAVRYLERAPSNQARL